MESAKSGDRGSAAARLEGLDALRGIAALLVALMHIGHIAGEAGWFARAYLAVDLFFVLSGYVMARTYEARMAGGLGAALFARLRLKRLWPTMAVGAVFAGLMFWSSANPVGSLMALAMLLLFVPWLGGGQPPFPTNPPAWSILFEIFANVLHALLLWRLGTRWLLALMLASVAALFSLTSHMDVGGGEANFWLGVPRVVYSYCAGILIWRLVRERTLLPGWAGIMLLAGGILGLGAAPSGALWLDFVFVFALCPVIVIAGLSRLPFGRAVFRELGAVSFPLYAIHYPLAMLAMEQGFGMASTLAAALVAAWLTDFAVTRRWRTFAKPAALPA